MSGTQEDWRRRPKYQNHPPAEGLFWGLMCFFLSFASGPYPWPLRYMFQGLIAQVYTGILKETGNDINKKPLQVTWVMRDHSHSLFVTIQWFKSGDWKNCNPFIWLILSHRFATCYSIISYCWNNMQYIRYIVHILYYFLYILIYFIWYITTLQPQHLFPSHPPQNGCQSEALFGDQHQVSDSEGPTVKRRLRRLWRFWFSKKEKNTFEPTRVCKIRNIWTDCFFFWERYIVIEL